MNHRFRVSTSRSGRRRDVQFVVYVDVARLRRDGERYSSGRDGEIQAVGLSQPKMGALVSADGSVRRYRGAGTIRLWKDMMGLDVLAHECLHMALAIYREDFTYQDVRYARDDDDAHRSLATMDNEEMLCHIVSDLVRGAAWKLYQLGVYA